MAIVEQDAQHANATAATISVDITCPVNCVLTCMITTNASGGVTGITGGDGHTAWAQIATTAASGNHAEMWRAVTSDALTTETIECTQGTSSFITIDVTAHSGADLTTPFETANILTNTANADITNFDIDATGTNRILSNFRGTSASPTPDAGWTSISGANFQLAQYKDFTGSQTGLTVPNGSATTNGGIAATLLAAAAGGATPKGPLGHPFHGPFGGPV